MVGSRSFGVCLIRSSMVLDSRSADLGDVLGKYEINAGDNYHKVTYDECMGEMKEIATTCQKNG
jgi:hypothetical protein